MFILEDAVTYHPTPARLHEATIGTGGKRPFKARHCNFSILRIGTFQVMPLLQFIVKYLHFKCKSLCGTYFAHDPLRSYFDECQKN